MVRMERMTEQYISRGTDLILSIDQMEWFVISQKRKSEGVQNDREEMTFKGTVQRDLMGVKVVLIDWSPFKLPTLRSGF